MINLLTIAAACGYMYSPGPEWDAKPLPPKSKIFEVPYREMRDWCQTKDTHLFGCSFEPNYKYTYIPSKANWPGKEECRLEAIRHEMAHAKGATHADMIKLR